MKKLLLILALAISANAWAHVTGNVELKCNEINGEQEYLVNLPTETHGMGMIEDINRSMKFDIKFLVLTETIEARGVELCETLGECDLDDSDFTHDMFYFVISRTDLTAEKYFFGEDNRTKISTNYQCIKAEDRRKKNIL